MASIEVSLVVVNLGIFVLLLYFIYFHPGINGGQVFLGSFSSEISPYFSPHLNTDCPRCDRSKDDHQDRDIPGGQGKQGVKYFQK